MTSNCQCGRPAKPQAVELAKLEAVLADCRARKASAKPGTPALIACLSEKLTDTAAVKNAVQARLDAGKAMLAAAEAKVRAKQAAAALLPPARATQQPAATMPANLSANERRAWSKAQSTMTAENATRFTDSYLTQAATNQFSPPAEKEIARAEMEARGFVFHGKSISKSLI